MDLLPGISIIIPCYNSRETIERCLKSLENDIINTEVIIVEDCSENDSEDIIEKYRKGSALEIIYVKNKENLGAGETRNVGIRLATKKYLSFVDSDDELSNEYFQSVCERIDQDYDEIVYDAKRVFTGEEREMNMFYSDSLSEGEIDQKEALVYIKGCTCGKIYKTEKIKHNNVTFATIPRNEDMVFTKVATSYMTSVYYIKKPLYLYNNNSSSLMNNQSLLSTENAIRAYQIVNDRLRNRLYSKELNSILFVEVLYSTTATLIKLKQSRKEIRNNYNCFRKKYNANDMYRNKYSIIYKISFVFFEFHLFGLYGRIREYLASR